MSPCYLPIMPFGTEHHAKLLSILGATPFPYSRGFSPNLHISGDTTPCRTLQCRLLALPLQAPRPGGRVSVFLSAHCHFQPCFSTYGSEVKYHPASPSLLSPLSPHSLRTWTLTCLPQTPSRPWPPHSCYFSLHSTSPRRTL